MAVRNTEKILTIYTPFPMCIINGQGKVINTGSKIDEVFIYDAITDADIFALTNIKHKDFIAAAEGTKNLTLSRNDKIFKIHVSQVGKEQKEAAQLLGLTPFQTFRHITLPQAYKTMMPLVGGELKLLLRSTSYAGYIAQKDLVKAVDAIRALTFDSFVPLLIVSLIYLLLSWLIGKGLNLLYVKFIKHD